MKADMPTAPTSERGSRWRAFLFVLKQIGAIGATTFFGAALLCSSGCKRSATKSSAETTTENAKPLSPTKPSPSSKRDARQLLDEEGYAVWYDVPTDSLARHRAAKGEYTAAHNRLRLGAMVRVTHIANGKSVIVRITDRGITDKRFMIDLCKEAAAELGMLSEGMARVRIEELPDDKRVGAEPAPNSKASAAHP